MMCGFEGLRRGRHRRKLAVLIEIRKLAGPIGVRCPKHLSVGVICATTVLVANLSCTGAAEKDAASYSYALISHDHFRYCA